MPASRDLSRGTCLCYNSVTIALISFSPHAHSRLPFFYCSFFFLSFFANRSGFAFCCSCQVCCLKPKVIYRSVALVPEVANKPMTGCGAARRITFRAERDCQHTKRAEAAFPKRHLAKPDV